MKVEFRKSFEKDIRKIRDSDLLAKIKAVVSDIDLKHFWDRNMKALKVMATIDEQGQLTLDRPYNERSQ